MNFIIGHGIIEKGSLTKKEVFSCKEANKYLEKVSPEEELFFWLVKKNNGPEVPKPVFMENLKRNTKRQDTEG